MGFQPDREFGSLTEAFEFVFDQYANRAPDLLWKETGGPLWVPEFAPRYLFRGECGDFPATLSAARRPSTYDSAVSVHELLQLTKALIWRPQQPDFGLDESSALALLQHYGFPTTIIDFTGNLACAFAFAAKRPSGVGRVAIVPRESLARVLDLTEHEWAERPRRQAAFGLVLPPGIADLKSDSARRCLRISWYQFPVLASDAEFFKRQLQEMVSTHDDPSAGFLRLFITEYVEARGKLSQALTKWLLSRIPIAPMCYLIKAFEGTEVVVNYRDSEILDGFEKDVETRYSRDYWSGERSSWDRMCNWRWPQVGAVVADPRTYHPDGSHE